MRKKKENLIFNTEPVEFSQYQKERDVERIRSSDLLSEKSQQLIDYWQTRALTMEGNFERLQRAVLEYFNDFDIHPHTNSGIEAIWWEAKIKVNKKRGWILDNDR